jgi:hypothetical protein
MTQSPVCDSTDCTVVQSAAALLQGPDVGASPALRSALFQVLAHVPGVSELGTVTDQGGQTGIGLSFTTTNPAHTLSVHCATGGAMAHTNSSGVYVPYEPATIGPAIPFQEPATATTLEFIIDPITTSVIGTQDATSPDMQPVPNVCPGQPDYGGQPQLGFVAPRWTNVVSEGVVSSTTSTAVTGY